MKNLYKGQFNYQGEIHTLYRYAKSNEGAKGLMIIELSKRLGISASALRLYFSGSRDNYSVWRD
jgi:hypothetical protein